MISVASFCGIVFAACVIIAIIIVTTVHENDEKNVTTTSWSDEEYTTPPWSVYDPKLRVYINKLIDLWNRTLNFEEENLNDFEK